MKLKFVAVFEQTPNNWCAYIPDLPGCISTGKTWEKMQEMIKEAVTGHIEVMLEHGEPLPETRMTIEEAIACHAEPLTEAEMTEYLRHGDPPALLSTTFQPIEVEVTIPTPASTRLQSSAPSRA